MLRFLVFDLDETLYPAGTGMFGAIGRRINLYMEHRLGLPGEEVSRLRRLYWERYGTTLRGLQLHHQVDPEDYLAFVHDIDVTAYLHPDPALDTALEALDQEKVIFTNATAEHARRVTEALGVTRHFRRIFDIRFLRFLCKPHRQAYRMLLAALPASPDECLLIDDSLRNLQAGKTIGMRTLLVGAEGQPGDGADLWLKDVRQIRDAVLALS